MLLSLDFIKLHVTSAVTHKVEPVAFDFGSRLAPFRAKKPLQVPGDAVPSVGKKNSSKFQHLVAKRGGLAGRECRHSAMAAPVFQTARPLFAVPL